MRNTSIIPDNCYKLFASFKREQLIMWWGGLRGAVGFSLAMVLKEEMWYRCEYHSYYHHFYPEIFMNIENMLCNFIIL